MVDKRGMHKNVAQYGDAEFSIYLRKAFLKAMGYTDQALERQIIGIIDTRSDYNPCHRNIPDLIEAAKRGIMLAGGIPMVFPVISLQESFTHPTSMYLRNLMAMDVEEMIRAQPMDAVILLGGCDKTVPALLMGAASANIPAILLVTGPMSAGSWRGEKLGACTDCRRLWGRYRSGELNLEEISWVNDELAPTIGTCGVMGTASTMALAAESLGIMVPGGACTPAVFAERRRLAERTGERAVQMATEHLTPSKIMTPAAFRNAFKVVLAVGGSTNTIIHLTAIAGRLGIRIDLDRIDAIGRDTPVLVDLKPTGQHYMEDLHRAGGLTPVLRQLRPMLELDCLTVTGRSLGENLSEARPDWPQTIVRPLENPIHTGGSLAILKGNIAPGGAVIKQAAATPRLLRHRGRAVVFETLADLANRLDSPDLDVLPDDILVLRNAGPVGGPGMPEAGYIPIPRKLAQNGVTDMIRISDARMSGTAFGTIVLHITPEATIGGPLALIQNGDFIILDVEERRLELDVSAKELAQRRAAMLKRPGRQARGYEYLYLKYVTQADKGCDFEFAIPQYICRM